MQLTLEQALTWGQEQLLLKEMDLSPPQALKKARLLLSYALKKDISYIFGFPEKTLSLDENSLFEEFILKASHGFPLSRILQFREFWSLPFFLNVATLDPRPDSELIIDMALKMIPDQKAALHILDLGTGSGCLLLSLLHTLPKAKGIGVDLSFEATHCAQENARHLRLDQRALFIQGSWTEALEGKFDLIISNPPYIPTSDIPHLESNVRLFDPLLALDGGQDGLDPYRYLIPKFKNLLSDSGFALLEIGATQFPDVEKIFKTENFQEIQCHLDLEGRPRVISAHAS